MRICVISPSYPYKNRVEYVFVEQLCNEWAKQGHEVTVIAPQSITKNLFRKKTSIPKKYEFYIGQNHLTIYRPKIITIGNTPLLGGVINYSVTSTTIRKVLKNLPCKPDIIYCHFWLSASWVVRTAKELNIPLFVATGESVIKKEIKQKKNIKNTVKGVICVSTKNKIESISLGLTTDNKCEVIPNAIDNNLFKVTDSKNIREELHIKEDDFVVIFVGSFKQQKGVNRVCEAINLLNDLNIKSIFIGSGSLKPNCNGIIFCNKLQHDIIPKYLNASDVFVLPTLHEGCCNAIIEAMACGLPIISSNLDFNYDILNNQNSILIDPLNINEISEAIKKLKADYALRKSLSQGSIDMTKELTISNRASKIINFMKIQILEN